MASHSEEHLTFDSPPETHSFGAVLYDMDGSIVDSTKAIVRHWHKIAEELGVDPNVILATSHGRRSIEVLQLYDPGRANWDYVRQVEGMIPKQFGQDAVEIPGSRALLAQLEEAGAPWAIVTSGTRPLVEGWLEVMKLARPGCLVTAEDVERGKPDPQCYLLGRARLGLPEDAAALVLEDAPAGIRAGKAAGFRVVALATTHPVGQLREAGADWVVRDARSVTLKGWDREKGVLSVEISNTLTTG